MELRAASEAACTITLLPTRCWPPLTTDGPTSTPEVEPSCCCCCCCWSWFISHQSAQGPWWKRNRNLSLSLLLWVQISPATTRRVESSSPSVSRDFSGIVDSGSVASRLSVLLPKWKGGRHQLGFAGLIVGEWHNPDKEMITILNFFFFLLAVLWGMKTIWSGDEFIMAYRTRFMHTRSGCPER